MNKLAVISRLLLPALMFSSAACNKRVEHKSDFPSTPSTPISDQERLKNELIASLRADLAKLRSSKEPSQNDIYGLAQALDQVMREDPSTASYGTVGTWNTVILAHGTKKSADLAADYLRLLQASQAEVAQTFDKRAEETAKQIVVKMFDAKTARELDAPLLEISTLQGQTNAKGDTNSSYGQLLLLRQFVAVWREFLMHQEAGENAAAVQCLERLKSNAESIRWLDPGAVSNAIQAARQSTGIPSATQLDAKIKSLIERAFSASIPADIDSLLIETGKLKSFGGQLPERGSNRISSVERFIENIQGALFARETKDHKEFHEFLSRIENQETDELGVPRSRLLIYVHEMKQSASSTETKPLNPAVSAAAAAARMTSWEAITPNLPALRLALDSDPSIPFASFWRLDLLILEFMVKHSEQLKAGRGLQRAVHDKGLHMTSDPSIRELQRQHDMLCLNIAFSEETRLLPAEKETTRDFTARLKKKLVELGKWESLQTLYTATRALKIMDPVINADDDAAVSGFLYGLRLENEAKDLRMATCAFQTVLTSPSKLVPASLVGGHLEKIRKADHQAYQQGSSLALNISKSEGKRAPGERAAALQWVIPARKPWSSP